MKDKIIQFHEDHEVKYTLMVEIDGELLAKHTDSYSADNVAGYAWQLDQEVDQYIIGEEVAKAEAIAEAQMEQMIEERSE